MNKHYISLELAKRIKELGFEQKSEKYWYYDGTDMLLDYKEEMAKFIFDTKKTYSAFSVGELGDMLPKVIDVEFEGRTLQAEYHHIIPTDCLAFRHFISYELPIGDVWCSISENTEADCRAKMLIYLKENGYL